jgi:hypothetical protein
MAQSPEKIAKDIVVAWLSHNSVAADANDTTRTGERIGKVYQAVLAAVQGAGPVAASVAPEPEPTPEQRRRRR